MEKIDSIKLFDLQKPVVAAAQEGLLLNNWFALMAGQRSGKSIMLAHIIKNCGYKRVFIIGTTKIQAQSEVTVLKKLLYYIKVTAHSHPPKDLIEGDFARDSLAVLAVVLDPFWFEDSYDVFNGLRDLGPTIAIGSNGPEYAADKRWEQLFFEKYATWDLNPNVTHAMIDAQFGFDSERAKRDFGTP